MHHTQVLIIKGEFERVNSNWWNCHSATPATICVWEKYWKLNTFVFDYYFVFTLLSIHFFLLLICEHRFIHPHKYTSSLMASNHLFIFFRRWCQWKNEHTSNVPVSLAVSEKSSPSEPTFFASGDDGCDGIDVVVVVAADAAAPTVAAADVAAAAGKAVGCACGTVDIFVLFCYFLAVIRPSKDCNLYRCNKMLAISRVPCTLIFLLLFSLLVFLNGFLCSPFFHPLHVFVAKTTWNRTEFVLLYRIWNEKLLYESWQRIW